MFPPFRYSFLFLFAQLADVGKMGALRAAIQPLLLRCPFEEFPAVVALADAEFHI
jgi:hypothetical protein